MYNKKEILKRNVYQQAGVILFMYFDTNYCIFVTKEAFASFGMNFNANVPPGQNDGKRTSSKSGGLVWPAGRCVLGGMIMFPSNDDGALWTMAPLWHHGVIAPRAPQKNILFCVGKKMLQSKS